MTSSSQHRECDAERIRQALRQAGIPEWHEDGGGFDVAVGHGEESFSVAAATDRRPDPVELEQMMAAYTRALTARGWRVGSDTGPDPDPQVLDVWVTPS
ncbi:hypothetical protein [Actinoallomurus sp. NPDC052274]|uniref:hypothetical protein n=1 Tax=Actinoallomurus sp. NPDC052274 TaxID=3155420 RepID=UPI0034498193